MAYSKHQGKKAQKSNLPQSSATPSKTNMDGVQRGRKPLNLKTDTGFKHIFSEKVFMIDFLNNLLGREDKIIDVTYNPTETLPPHLDGKKVIYDLSCTTDKGEFFVVEMQYEKHPYFKDRAIYYMSRQIDKQLNAKTKKRRRQMKDEGKEFTDVYRLEPVYGVFIMNFHLDSSHPRLMRDVMFCDHLDNGRVFYDQVRMFFLELPEVQSEENCDNGLKQWLYMIRNMEKLKDDIRFAKNNPIFLELMERADEGTLTEAEEEAYFHELNNFLIWNSMLGEKFEKGMAEGRAKGEAIGRAEGEAIGRAEGRAEIAKNLKNLGSPLEIISQATGLTLEEIEKL